MAEEKKTLTAYLARENVWYLKSEKRYTSLLSETGRHNR
jgi:hypothetical protein